MVKDRQQDCLILLFFIYTYNDYIEMNPCIMYRKKMGTNYNKNHGFLDLDILKLVCAILVL